MVAALVDRLANDQAESRKARRPPKSTLSSLVRAGLPDSREPSGHPPEPCPRPVPTLQRPLRQLVELYLPFSLNSCVVSYLLDVAASEDPQPDCWVPVRYGAVNRRNSDFRR